MTLAQGFWMMENSCSLLVRCSFWGNVVTVVQQGKQALGLNSWNSAGRVQTVAVTICWHPSIAPLNLTHYLGYMRHPAMKTSNEHCRPTPTVALSHIVMVCGEKIQEVGTG